MVSKGKMSMKRIEAYSIDSEYRIPGSSHCMVVTDDKKICWENKGRGWDVPDRKTRVAENDSYWEWLLNFVPPNNIEKCGIDFARNGLCHTYATRELLVGTNNVDVGKAPKNYVCVVFFGKYGMGLNELKEILTNSYNDTMASYEDPYNALGIVLARVDDTVDFELAAWRRVAIEYTQIPVDEILAKDPDGGLWMARGRMRRLIDKREDVYQRYKSNIDELHRAVGSLIRAEADDYLSFLEGIGYITESDRAKYSDNIRSFLGSVIGYVNAQRTAYLRSGIASNRICFEDFIEE